MAARRVPVDKRTLVWRSYDAFNRRDPDAAVPLLWQLSTVVDGRIETVQQSSDRDEALSAAGVTPAAL